MHDRFAVLCGEAGRYIYTVLPGKNLNSLFGLSQMSTFGANNFTNLTRSFLSIFLFLTLYLPGHTIAQVNSWVQRTQVTYRVGYGGNGSQPAAVSDAILRDIAEDEIRHPSRTHIDVHSDLKVKISTPEGSIPVIEISFSEPRLTGDIRFRKFIISDQLIPDRVDFTVRIEKKDTASSFLLLEATNQDCPWNDSVVLRRPIPRFSPDTDTVLVENLKFWYDRDRLPAFRERLALINDFYAASSILDTLRVKFDSMDFGNLERYPSYFVTLEEMNKILAIIGEKKFGERLHLDSLDPVGFRAKFSDLTSRAKSSSMTFRMNLKSTWNLPHRFPADSLVHDYLSGILRYIRWSMLVNERNSRIYQDYLDRYFTMNAFGNDLEVIGDMAGIWFPGENADTVFAGVSEMMNKGYHDLADTLMNRAQYAEAVDLLAHAAKFAGVNPYLQESARDRQTITKAANGIYDSFLGVAEGAIRNKRLDMAQSYVARAQAYRKEHASYVTSDSLFKRVYGELVSVRLSKCDSLMASSLYSEVLGCYSEFEQGFDSLTLSLIHPEFDRKIQVCRYKDLTNQGRNKLAASDYPEAGRLFFLARTIWEGLHSPADPVLDSLCHLTYPFYLVHLVYTGESLIWTNRLGRAQQFVDSIAFIQRTTGMESSRELSDVIARYRRKIGERSCWNANESAEVFLLRSETERHLKDFILAASLTDSAVAIAKMYTDCVIPLTGVSDTAAKYREVLLFQRMQKQVEFRIMAARYQDAISGYQEMEAYFRSHEISPFGLNCLPMYEFVRTQAIRELTLQAFLFSQKLHNLTECYRYVLLLQIQEYPRKPAVPLLEWLGREYARKDFSDQPDKDPVVLVQDYSVNDRWMKSFRVAYLNEAARLRHHSPVKYLFRK
jgi:hypothetical protein